MRAKKVYHGVKGERIVVDDAAADEIELKGTTIDCEELFFDAEQKKPFVCECGVSATAFFPVRALARYNKLCIRAIPRLTLAF